MQEIPFKKVKSIRERLADSYLVNLVGVFSKKLHEDLLLVYLIDGTPNELPSGSQAIGIADLGRYDLELFDGPVVALSAIDLARADIPTKGPSFYALDEILRDRKLYAELRRTLSGLGRYLYPLWQDQPESESKRRALLEIATLHAPAILELIPHKDLLALIPDEDLGRYLHESACRIVYLNLPETNSIPTRIKAYSLNDSKSLGTGSNEALIIGLEEFRGFVEPCDPPDACFSELRLVLRDTGLDQEIPATLRKWSSDFAQKPGNDNRATAFALASKSYLMGEDKDVDDLVAILPANDLQEFIAEGTAIYCYRQLGESEEMEAPVGRRRLSLQSLETFDLATAGFGEIAFSLLPIRSLLNNKGVNHWRDLGPILYHASQTLALERSAWLLVSDLLEAQKEGRVSSRVPLDDMFQTILHACVLLSLENPWSKRQGRYDQILSAAYNCLDQVLQKQAQSSQVAESKFYRALVLWYSCGELEDTKIENVLESMLSLVQEYQRDSYYVKGLHSIRDQSEKLGHIGEAMLHMLSGGGQPEVIQRSYVELTASPGGVQREMNRASNMLDEIDTPSRLFINAFEKYADIVTEVLRIRTSQIPVDDKIIRLREKIKEFERNRRLLFALHHEEQVLGVLYKRIIEQTSERADELQGSAQLDVQLLTTTPVSQHQETILSFTARNIGRAESESVDVELLESERFEVREKSSVKSLPPIIPDGITKFEFKIYPKFYDDFPIRLRILYPDARRDSQDFLVHVFSLDQGPFEPKPNPYIYGVHLEDYRLFYGRRDKLSELLNHLARGLPQNILLRGARRSGKTSLLYMLKAIIEDRNGNTGARAWFRVPQGWSDALDNVVPVLLNLQLIERPKDTFTPTAFFREVLQGISDASLQNERLQRTLAETVIGPGQFERTLNATLNAYPQLRIALITDEFDVLDQIEDKSFYMNLRQVIERVQRITWIVASALGLYRQVRAYESPLFNVFKIIDLGRLEPEAARRLILDPWESDRIGTERLHRTLQLTGDAVDAILEETARYPYFIQLLCSAVVEYINSVVHRNYVLRGTVYDVIEKIIAPNSAAYEHFAYLWEMAGGVGRAVLLVLLRAIGPLAERDLWTAVRERLAREYPDLPDEWAESQYADSLRRLQVVQAVALDSSNRYVFDIPLFRRLLLERSEREDLWYPTLAELRADFERSRNIA